MPTPWPRSPAAAPRLRLMRSKAELHAAIQQRRRTALVVNTRSRRGLRLYQEASRQLHAAGFNLLGSFPVDRPGRLETHLDAALGVLPLGTTNNFARTLGLPLNVTAAVAVLTSGKVADVDLGQADDAMFANLVSIGLSGHVAANVRHDLKRVLGRAAYPLTAL